MSEQLQDLIKRAGEARAQKRQKELDRKFFAWLEDTFNINHYDKTNAYGQPAAIVDNSLVFVRTKTAEMTACIYLKCNLCINEVHNFGVVRNIEELGELLNIDKEGNFPIVCKYMFLKQPQTPVNLLFSQERAATT